VVQTLDARNIVGESIVWDDRFATLYWVDIISSKIHSLQPDLEKQTTWHTPSFATSIGLREDQGAIVGLQKDLALWEFTDEFVALATLEPDLPENRLNEGVFGPDGAYWVGTMQNNINHDTTPRDLTDSTGSLYRVQVNGNVDRIIELPCLWPTSCTFGGPDLTRLYVTSARFTMSDEHLRQHPQEGALFEVEIGVPGKPSHRFGQPCPAGTVA